MYCTEDLAQSETSTGDVYFVPAFSGLYAPYWETDARGIIVGLTNYTNKAHLCRATLEAVCFQSREVCHKLSSYIIARLAEPIAGYAKFTL